MRRLTTILIALISLTLLSTAPAKAGIFSKDNTLVTIDGIRYTSDDFKHWWEFWREEKTPLPETPDAYIDWLLLSQEAKRLKLDDSPGFKRQARIFIQARALLLLQNDAVTSRVKITDADIKNRYEEKYLPIWEIQRLEFKDEERAQAAWQELQSGALTIDELLERKPEQNGPVSIHDDRLRPVSIDQGWATIFQNLEVGEVADPSNTKHGPNLYYLKAKKSGGEEDFAKWREGIQRALWQEQTSKFTNELLSELRDKYQLQVDEERLAALDINADEDTFTDEPIITSNRQNVSEKEFMAVIHRLIDTRTNAAHATQDEEKAASLKRETRNNIIVQNMTNWESLDRHYEEKEPFKWEYQFFYNSKMVAALEQRFFASEVKVTEDEIKAHYEKNISSYIRPSTVKLFIIDETQGPIDKIWLDTSLGKRFKKVMKQYEDQVVAKLREIPTNHIDPDVKAVVDKLVEGETSRIFEAQGVRLIVHLVERVPETPVPLDKVKGKIRSKLRRKKYNQLRKNFLETLKSHSEIDIKWEQWETIQKELGEKNES